MDYIFPTKKYLYLLNASALLIHMCFLTFFTVYEVWFMAGFNILSILTYVACFGLIARTKMKSYIMATVIEIQIHMVCAVYCLGGSYGFQLYFFACSAACFYLEYFCSRVDKVRFRGLIMAILSAVLFVVCLFIEHFRTPIYVMDEKLAWYFLAGNAAICFTITIFYFLLLTRAALFCERELQRQADYDKLTDLANRNYLLRYLEDECSSDEADKLVLAMMDIDDFKKVNDVYGHSVGDEVLCGIADILKECTADFVVSRWGGEEFIVVGKCENGVDEMHAHMETLRSAVERCVFTGNTDRFSLTITVGIEKFDPELNIDRWIQKADEKLYVGKKSGKNKIVA